MDALQADTTDHLERPSSAEELKATLLAMVAAPNLASKSWVTSQYDRYVLGNTVLAQPEDAGMIRIDEVTGLGVALATDCNGRFTKLDPYAGAQLALSEAYRNVAASGAKPLAVTNCLNFGSPEDPEVMWQFAEATRGLADGCLQLGTPVTGGNVSFYNQTGDRPILPTPVVGVLGVIRDVAMRTSITWGAAGDYIYLLGDTKDEFGGSEWANHVHGHLGGLPPKVDLDRERALGEVLVSGSMDSILVAAHDVSDGGAAQVLVEMALRAGTGATIAVPPALDPFVFMFSESAGRAVVVVNPIDAGRLTALCEKTGVPLTAIGAVSDDDNLVFADLFTVSLGDLRREHERTLPELFG
jgi:phosphoribosylformylglycinamidine synthase